jgi:hypothetical protein
LGVEEIDSVDFFGIDNIVSNSPNNDFNELNELPHPQASHTPLSVSRRDNEILSKF